MKREKNETDERVRIERERGMIGESEKRKTKNEREERRVKLKDPTE